MGTIQERAFTQPAPHVARREQAVDEPRPPRASEDAGRPARERRRARARWTKRAIVGLLALATLAGIALALMPRPVPVDVFRVRRGPMQVTVDETGRTRVPERYLVASPVSGRMARVDWEPGDAVAAGQVLVRVSPVPSPLLDDRSRAEAERVLAAAVSAERQARTVVQRARVALDQARRELARRRTLAEAGSVPQVALEEAEYGARALAQDLAAAELGAKVAHEEAERVRALLAPPSSTAGEAFEVRAPSGGTVLKVLQEGPGPIAAGTPLVELGDLSKLEAVIDVLSTDAVQIRPGARARLERWGGEAPIAATVSSVEPSAFTRLSALGLEEQRVNVILGIEPTAQAAAPIGDGYRVEARIVVWESPDVLAVPVSALFRSGEGWALYRVDAGRARLQPVAIGRRNSDVVQILEGVEDGAEIVAYPGDRLHDGVRVKPRDER